jgi:hypothetical protein
LSFNRDELDAIEAWTATAKPLSGIYYRSVEYRYMDPKEVQKGRFRVSAGLKTDWK